MANLDKQQTRKTREKPQVEIEVPRIILPDTTLCAIVRDEMMNPAGGIKRFVQAIVPYVEQAVIVDTGSVDGTRQALEEMQAQYPNLKVHDTKFKGYAEARNVSLDLAQTPQVLVLDADELIVAEDFAKLFSWLPSRPSTAYGFKFFKVREEPREGWGNNPRLFTKSPERIYANSPGDIWKYEILGDPRKTNTQIPTSICKIFHFFPQNEDEHNLKLDWYNYKRIPKKAPSQIPGFKKWKTYNPSRDLPQFDQ